MVAKYRPCAGAVVFNREGKVLLCSRIDVPGDHWQFPQGGIEANESPAQAAKRELFEETSITSVVLVYSDSHFSRYDFPLDVQKKFAQKGIFTAGQDIYFSLYFFNGNEEEINLNTANPEFKKYVWKDLQFAVDNIVPFKKPVYLSLVHRLVPEIQQYLNNIS